MGPAPLSRGGGVPRRRPPAARPQRTRSRVIFTMPSPGDLSGAGSRRRCPTPRANTVDGQLRLVYRQVTPSEAHSCKTRTTISRMVCSFNTSGTAPLLAGHSWGMGTHIGQGTDEPRSRSRELPGQRVRWHLCAGAASDSDGPGRTGWQSA